MDKVDKSARLQYSAKIKEDFPEVLQLAGQEFRKKIAMRYGENPGYPAAFYVEAGATGRIWPPWKFSRKGRRG